MFGEDFFTHLQIGFLPGFLGGFTTFLYALNKGHYKNNQYIQKLLLELFGGGITAFFSLLLFYDAGDFAYLVSFMIGLTWTKIIQTFREKITKIVKAAIN